MTHTANCRWERTTNTECEYRATHRYCPHPEHECDCSAASPSQPEEAEPTLDALIDKVGEHGIAYGCAVAPRYEQEAESALVEAKDALRSRITSLESDNARLTREHDVLMERSAGAMAIAEDDDWKNIPLDCPMLVAVAALRSQRDAMRDVVEAAKEAQYECRGRARSRLMDALASPSSSVGDTNNG